MRTQLRRMGNSYGGVIPKAIVAQLGVEPGAELELTLEEGIASSSRQPTGAPARAGPRPRAIAAAGDDGPA